MRNAVLDEAQAGIKISGRNINNLRHADDTTLMAESEELKSLLMKVTEDEMVGWHQRLNEHEFEQILGHNEGQRSLACCSLCDRKESDMS